MLNTFRIWSMYCKICNIDAPQIIPAPEGATYYKKLHSSKKGCSLKHHLAWVLEWKQTVEPYCLTLTICCFLGLCLVMLTCWKSLPLRFFNHPWMFFHSVLVHKFSQLPSAQLWLLAWSHCGYQRNTVLCDSVSWQQFGLLSCGPYLLPLCQESIKLPDYI